MCRFARTVGFLCRVFCAGLLIIHLFPVSAFAADYVPGEVIVMFKPGVQAAERNAFEQSHGLTLLNAFPEIRAAHYKLPPEQSVEEAIDALSGDPIVQHVGPNRTYQPMAVPNDPRYPQQWYLNNTGQVVNGVSGPAGIDIKWQAAMDIFTGTTPVIVAVVDSGVALDHPEINPKRWINPRETLNGIDDDGNGLVDDIIGWDFFDARPIPLDENGHGTLVASIIGAMTNNGDGIAGVAPTVQIMALRIGNDFGQVSTAAWINAFVYAASNGARIINASFGRLGPSDPIELATIQWLDSQGVLVVAAAGNGLPDGIGDNNDLIPFFPASYPVRNVISVAAVERSGSRATFSNFGANSVHLAAPGTEIFGSTVKRAILTSADFTTGSAPGWLSGILPGAVSTQRWQFQNFGGLIVIDEGSGLFVYEPFVHTALISPPVTLRLGSQAQLFALMDLGFGDCLVVEVSADAGATWLLAGLPKCGPFLTDFSSLGNLDKSATISFDMSRFDFLTIQLRMRFFSDGISQGDGVWLLGAQITEVVPFAYDGTQYKFDQGTSFSAPLVSGVAALIMSQRPDLTHHQVRDIILNSVTKTAPLDGKVATGGQLNALAALQAAIAMPPPDATPPTVTARTPAPGATAVSAATAVTATFSEDVNPATVNTSTFQLRDVLNNMVTASVTYNAGTRTATLSPSFPLGSLAAYTARVVGGASGVKDLAGNALVGDVSWSFTTAQSAVLPPPTNIFSAVLPVSRSAVVGSPVTVFGTIINAGTSQAATCGVALSPTAPAGLSLTYQTTDPATNQVIGTPNTPANIAPAATQSFVVALTPSAPFGPVDLPLVFDCENSPPAPAFVGVNTLLVSASTTPVPDVVALAATLTGDGIVNIPGASGTGVFAVASVNVGAGGAITVAADTGSAPLPIALTICQTNPGTGQCLQPPAGSVATTIASGATPTFAIFARGTGSVVPFDPAGNRVFVRFRDAGGIVRGATSVAVRTQ